MQETNTHDTSTSNLLPKLNTYRGMNQFLQNETEKFLNWDKNTATNDAYTQENASPYDALNDDKEYSQILRHLILCEHACYGTVYKKTTMMSLGDTENQPHTSYHIYIKEHNDKQICKVAYVAAMKSATAMMMAATDLNNQLLNIGYSVSDVQYSTIRSKYENFINDVNKRIKDLENATDDQVNPKIVGKMTTAMIKEFQADIATVLLPPSNHPDYKSILAVMKALVENINVGFETTSTFQHQEITHQNGTTSVVTTAQGYIGGLTDEQKKIAEEMSEILSSYIDSHEKNDALKSSKDFEKYLRKYNYYHQSQSLKSALNILKDMPHEERIAFHYSMTKDKTKETIFSGNYIPNAQKKGFTARNPNEIMVLESKLTAVVEDPLDKKYRTHVVRAFSSQASLTGPASREILAQNIEMHGLNEPNNKPKFFINLRFHAAPPTALLAFVRNKPLNILLNIIAAPIVLLAAASYILTKTIKYKGKAFSKDNLLMQMADYHKQFSLFATEKKNYKDVTLAIGKIPLGNEQMLTEMVMNVDVSQISATFDEINKYVTGQRQNSKESSSLQLFNKAYKDYHNLLKNGVVTYRERMELILRIAVMVEASREFVDIGMSSGCAQNKDRGPAGHMRAAQIAYVEMILNDQNHGDPIRYDEKNQDHKKIAMEVSDLFGKACMRPGGDVNGAGAGNTGSKATTIMGNEIRAFALNAEANKVGKNMMGKKSATRNTDTDENIANMHITVENDQSHPITAHTLKQTSSSSHLSDTTESLNSDYTIDDDDDRANHVNPTN